MCRLFRNSMSFNLLEPSGSGHACKGIALPFTGVNLVNLSLNRAKVARVMNTLVNWHFSGTEISPENVIRVFCCVKERDVKGESVNPQQFYVNCSQCIETLGARNLKVRQYAGQTDSFEIEGGAYVILKNKVDICIRNLPELHNFNNKFIYIYIYTRLGSKVSSFTYKSRAK